PPQHRLCAGLEFRLGGILRKAGDRGSHIRTRLRWRGDAWLLSKDAAGECIQRRQYLWSQLRVTLYARRVPDVPRRRWLGRRGAAELRAERYVLLGAPNGGVARI